MALDIQAIDLMSLDDIQLFYLGPGIRQKPVSDKLPLVHHIIKLQIFFHLS